MRLTRLLTFGIAAIAWAAPPREEARQHFERARQLYEEHDDSGEAAVEAEIEFRLALSRDPRFAPAIAYLGFLADDHQQAQPAETYYRRALAIDDRCAEARVGLARIEMRAGRVNNALRELRQAVADNPTNTLALAELAFTLSSDAAHPTSEMWEEAIRSWQVLVGLDRDDRDSHHQLAKALEHQGRWFEAETHYREVLRIGQTDKDSDVWVYSVHGDVAQMLERQEKYADAIREYEALLRSDGVGDEEIKNARTRIAALKPQKR